MNMTLILLGNVCCPILDTIVDEIASNGSDVLIVFIICITVLIICFKVCNSVSSYLNIKSLITFKQENEKHFLDFCYEMVKSTTEQDSKMKNECWDFLKKKHSVSENTKNSGK